MFCRPLSAAAAAGTYQVQVDTWHCRRNGQDRLQKPSIFWFCPCLICITSIEFFYVEMCIQLFMHACNENAPTLSPDPLQRLLGKVRTAPLSERAMTLRGWALAADSAVEGVRCSLMWPEPTCTSRMRCTFRPVPRVLSGCCSALGSGLMVISRTSWKITTQPSAVPTSSRTLSARVTPTCNDQVVRCTMRFGSTTKVSAKCKLKYHRRSE